MNIVQVDSRGKVVPKKRRWVSPLLEVDSNGEIFYCIAANVYLRKKQCWVPRCYYLHAINRINAVLKFCTSYPNRETHVIIEVAPAIGWIYDGQDKSGEVVKDKAIGDLC